MTKVIQVILTICFMNVLKHACSGSELPSSPNPIYHALVSITYKDPETDQNRTDKREGRYGVSSRIEKEEGVVVHVRTQGDEHHACTPIRNTMPSERWIALVERGNCKFSDKIRNTAVVKNASAVVIYDHHESKDLVTMDLKNEIVAIFIARSDGQRIARLVDNGTRVLMQIGIGKKVHGNRDGLTGSLNKTSVLFVSISFIVLMIISLAWLVFYYIQRFRYAHAKERLSRRLMHAAKKAISKMPMKTLKSDDKEVVSGYDQCAVCIEDYRAGAVIRILPCKHFYHKSCVDTWLIEHRNCPMCKMDILKAYGLQIQNSEASLVNVDIEHGSTSMGASDLLHALDSGLTPHEYEGSVHHVQMVCYHGLPATQRSAASFDGCLETDSSSEGQVAFMCVAPDIHHTQNDPGDTHGEQMGLLGCTCNQKHFCTPSKQASESVSKAGESCSCSHGPQPDKHNVAIDEHINDTNEETTLLEGDKCTCGKEQTVSVRESDTASAHSASSQSTIGQSAIGSNLCVQHDMDGVTPSLGSLSSAHLIDDDNEVCGSATSMRSTHSERPHDTEA